MYIYDLYLYMENIWTTVCGMGKGGSQFACGGSFACGGDWRGSLENKVGFNYFS